MSRRSRLSERGGEASPMERTLLFIDPDPVTHVLIERVLGPEGFSVFHAETALEGQEYAARLLPDLILVDVDRVRATEVITALRRCPGLERARLLASTAHAWPEHLEKMLALGFDRALVEPLDIDTLAHELRDCLPSAPAVDDTGGHEGLPQVCGGMPAPESAEDGAGSVSLAEADGSGSGPEGQPPGGGGGGRGAGRDLEPPRHARATARARGGTTALAPGPHSPHREPRALRRIGRRPLGATG